MARPIKKGLDYFPLDTNFMNDRLVRRLKRRFGYKSVMLYITLLCDIYANSYYIDIIDDYIFDLSEQLEMDEQKITEILHYMAELGLFHAGLFNEKQIFTSQSIQERYLLAKQKTAINQLIDEDYLLVIPEKTQVIPEKPLVIPEETPVIPSIIPQRKEKEKKEKENNIPPPPPARVRESEKVVLEQYHNELMDDEDWQFSVVQASGKGTQVLNLLPEIMSYFDAHIISTGETGEIRHINDYKRRLVSWWRCMKYQPVKEIIQRQNMQAAYPHKARQAPKSKFEEAMEVADRAAVMTLQLLKQQRA